MNSDEAEIRAVVQQWLNASKAGDSATILDLMTDDAVFTVVGGEPFGKETFAALSQSNDANMSIDGTNEIVELQVMGNWVFTRNRISITVRMADGEPVSRSGYTRTLYSKGDDGKWRLARDANLVT